MIKFNSKFLTIILLVFAVNCQEPDEEESDIQDLLFSLAAFSASRPSVSSSSPTATQTAETSCNTNKSSPISLVLSQSTEYVVKQGDICYFSFTNTTGSSSTFVFRIRPSVGDSDLASISGTLTGGNKPINFWSSGTGTGCTSLGWSLCTSASGTLSETHTINSFPNAGIIALGVFGAVCGSSTGCKFTIEVNQ